MVTPRGISTGTKTIVSLVLYVYVFELHCESLFTRSRYLQFHRPIFHVSLFSPRFRSLQKGKEETREEKKGLFSLSLSLTSFLLQVSCAVYRAQSSVNYYGPEGGLLLIGLLTSCLLLSRRRFFFLSSVLASARGENCQVLSLLGLLFLPLPRESNDQVGFGWPISYKIACPFRPAILASLMIFFFSSVCQNGALIFSLGRREKERREKKEQAIYIYILKIQNFQSFNRYFVKARVIKMFVKSCEAGKR